MTETNPRGRVKYDTESLRLAVLAYRNNLMSSVEAARKFGVPESTIRKHKNDSVIRVGGGKKRWLSNEQEEYLVASFVELDKMGVRLTKEVLQKLAGDYIRKVLSNEQKKSE